MKLLTEILGMKRPHKGANERYVGEVILTRLGLPIEWLFDDPAGEPVAYMICTDATSGSLFVAHLDTVHPVDGPNPLLFDMELEWMWKEDGTALGADDGAGVWLLYNMIERGVPGTYLFTTGEERGGVGAKVVRDHYSSFLSHFRRAITFDRKGTTSVISHQMACGRCCSDEFAVALSGALSEGMFNSSYVPECIYAPDSGGVYTDTAEFTQFIPECTNVSAGYRNEHGGSETLDVAYLKGLLETCLTLKWEDLPTRRDPKVIEYDDWDIGPKWWSKKYPTIVGDDDVYEYDGGFDWGNPAASLMMMTDEEILEMAGEDPNWAGEMLICAKYGELDTGELK